MWSLKALSLSISPSTSLSRSRLVSLSRYLRDSVDGDDLAFAKNSLICELIARNLSTLSLFLSHLSSMKAVYSFNQRSPTH